MLCIVARGQQEQKQIKTTILPWFDQNGMVANPADFQMILLGKEIDTRQRLNVNGKIIPEQVRLFGVTIDSNLS